MINAEYATWKKKSLTDRGWKDGKKYFRAALKDVSEITSIAKSESGLTVKSTVKRYNMDSKTARSWQQMAKSRSMKQAWSCNYRPTSNPQG